MEHDYNWEALSLDGEELCGVTSASSKRALIDSFQQAGMVIIKIDRAHRASIFSFSKLNPDEVHFFIVQLKTMLGSGLALLECLQILIDVSKKKALRDLIRDILVKIKAGETFSKVLSYYPQYFSSLTISLIEVGEQTGKLESALQQLLGYQEIQTNLHNKVHSALTYPLILLFSTALISVGLLVFVVPRFVDIFASMNSELPSLTQYVVHLSNWLSAYWLYLFMCIFLCVGLTKWLSVHYHWYRVLSARTALSLPIIGPILHKAVVIRYCKTLMTLLLSGVDITQACRRSAQVTDNEYFIHVLASIPQEMASGEPLSQALKRIKLIPDLMCQMIAVGEESGEINIMLEHTSAHYLSILSADVERLGQMLEPVFLLVLGGMVGLLVIALYLPIFDLMTVI